MSVHGTISESARSVHALVRGPALARIGIKDLTALQPSARCSLRTSLHGRSVFTDDHSAFVVIAKQLPTAFIEINQGDER